MSKGLRYVFTGNIHDSTGGSTWCPGCGGLLIERDWYQLGQWALHGNACAHCGHKIPGHFDQRPGNWGSKRQPVRLS